MGSMISYMASPMRGLLLQGWPCSEPIPIDMGCAVQVDLVTGFAGSYTKCQVRHSLFVTINLIPLPPEPSGTSNAFVQYNSAGAQPSTASPAESTAAAATAFQQRKTNWKAIHTAA